MPGNERKAAELLDAYLKAQDERKAEQVRAALNGESRDPDGLPISING